MNLCMPLSLSLSISPCTMDSSAVSSESVAPFESRLSKLECPDQRSRLEKLFSLLDAETGASGRGGYVVRQLFATALCAFTK